MDDWSRVLFTLKEGEKSVNIRWYVTNIYNIIVSIVIDSITKILTSKSSRI